MQLLPKTVQEYIDRSILCWLATSTLKNKPNVSPKEIFCYYNDGKESILVANIASPGTTKNIKSNPLVCISFIDILVQKGYQVHGTAEIIALDHENYTELEKPLVTMTKGKYPIQSIIRIYPTRVKPILAPSYLLNKDASEPEQIANAKKQYGL